MLYVLLLLRMYTCDIPTLISVHKQIFPNIGKIAGVGICFYKWLKLKDLAHSVNKLVRCKIGEGQHHNLSKLNGLEGFSFLGSLQNLMNFHTFITASSHKRQLYTTKHAVFKDCGQIIINVQIRIRPYGNVTESLG